MANLVNQCPEQLTYWRSMLTHTAIETALNLAKQIILCGPPGTGKTYLAKQFVEQHWNLPRERYEIVQFHPAYNYEDFVRGIQVSTNQAGQVQYRSVHRVFSEMCRSASNDLPENKYVLIIDEINRANLAAVLGELIYGLEYRKKPVHTPYEVGGSFDLNVPQNLYIIGTMNTADRSIGHIDYAVRRRFAFVPMVPDRTVIEQTVTPQGDLQISALQLYDAVASLFSNNDANDSQLTSDFFADDVQPGHTYFLAESRDQLLIKFVYQMLPLLHEYVKDGVLKSGATLRISTFPIQLKQPIRPTVITEHVRHILPCFQNPLQADGANGAE